MAEPLSACFVRCQISEEVVINTLLSHYYAQGWRVVSHCEAAGEYSFVFERPWPDPLSLPEPGPHPRPPGG